MVKKTDKSKEIQSFEEKLYLKTVGKFLSEELDNISIVDLGGSMFNGRVAYYEEKSKTVYLFQTLDGKLDFWSVKGAQEKMGDELNIFNLVPIASSVTLSSTEEETKNNLLKKTRQLLEDSTLSNNLENKDFVPFVRNHLELLSGKNQKDYYSILLLLELGLKAETARESIDFLKYLQEILISQVDQLKESPMDNKQFFPYILMLFNIDDILSGKLPGEISNFVKKSGIKSVIEDNWNGIDVPLHFVLKEMKSLGYINKKHFVNNPERYISIDKQLKSFHTSETFDGNDYKFLENTPFARYDIITMLNKKAELPNIFYKYFKEEKKICKKIRTVDCSDYYDNENKAFSLLNLYKKKILDVTFSFRDGNPLNKSGALSEVYLKERVLSDLKNSGAKFADTLTKYHKLISDDYFDFFFYQCDHKELTDTVDGIVQEAKSDLHSDLEKDFNSERDELERLISEKDEEIYSLNQQIDDLRDEISRLESW